MKKVEFELDVTRNIFSEIILGIINFFSIPIFLFKKYFKKFEIKKTSIFYNLVSYPLAEYLYKKAIMAVVVEGLFGIGLFVFEFDQNSIIIACSLIGVILFTPAFLKILFIFLVMFLELVLRLTKTTFLTFKSLFTEKEYY
ncbi:hypothetical protein A2130_01400 [Candidatus Woesebacteria bacterium GWC2_33_12]|uniref:Uncharacterized protein n=1 Tax=Candidatus Woesebacteria bacterium GW2011_GWB1_33_22 TaxID=1618566 RepID=A0A0F9ZJF3_9BACT|nr:MAG: hypothetical protein UR29_C0012G0025 [Candidatus Woesebacteria bacterium GW2011_GWC2_33_12]KKP41780.1 MAG: hypothetical protein UR33_C0010G0025 [Candidatus Woesebacteria bacterium GW2011_GWA2_33_20]KKP44234.1 MAG: hypothetical protein UR35_C0010G0026 [Candidatus Woesebacteria bacterium GW2011_GWB1_33_22]KKP45940.1 MAG: hypothetical protein UR37_C0013G0026 [Microgenomates group bacterium GW2011_GWC1_33_28]KKP49825.1 MAG: hypothetical protein UR41_C0012G0026 [Candidatus Woesebacteria bact